MLVMPTIFIKYWTQKENVFYQSSLFLSLTVGVGALKKYKVMEKCLKSKVARQRLTSASGWTIYECLTTFLMYLNKA